MTYTRPQTEVFQTFPLIPAEITAPLRAHLSGPNLQLHRYGVAAEKPLIALGAYNPNANTPYSWPGRTAGGVIDDTSAALFADAALLKYFDKSPGESGGTIAAVAGRPNWIESSELSFAANTSAYPASAVFGDRGVLVGDPVYLRSVSNDELCTVTELNTTVAGFASSTIDAVVGAATRDAGNLDHQSASVSILQTAGPHNCITATAVSPSAYSGLASGNVTEVYTVKVIKSSVAGCTAARLQVTSASGNDDVAEVTPAAFGSHTAIGTRGLFVIFHDTPGVGCSLSASDEDVAPTDLVLGQTWQVTVTQAFQEAFVESGGSYLGGQDDTYVITCTKGGLWTAQPQITVRTVKGLDYSGPTTVTGSNVSVRIGSQGVTIKFFGLGGDPGSSASLDYAEPVNGLRTGDKWYVPVTSSADGPKTRLILHDDLPTAMTEVTDMELALYITGDIQIGAEQLGNAPALNWSTNATQIIVNSAIQVYSPSWTVGGVQELLPLTSGSLYAQFNEFLPTLVGSINQINDVANIDAAIPGQLDPANILKWAVKGALANSNGTNVAFTAVLDPTDLDDWAGVLTTILGNTGVYRLVPLTFDVAVQNLFASHIQSESSPTSNNWKGGFFALSAAASQAIVSVATSTNSGIVLATVAVNPQASGSQYTLLQASNGAFITNGVQPGDTVRYQYAVDGFGNTTYDEYVVDSVLSQGSLLLTTSLGGAISIAEKVEIWHTNTADQLAANIGAAAGAFASSRVCAVWPDQISESGTAEAGYFLCAAIAGLASGVAPQQSLTNVAIAGFDGVTRTTTLFNSAQLDTMAGDGVWIVTQSASGVVYTRDAVTTNTSSLSLSKEAVQRNVDSMSFFFVNTISPFIGVANVTPSLIMRLNYELTTAIASLTQSNYTDLLGGQLISGVVTTLQQDPLLPDHVNIVLTLVEPFALDVAVLQLDL